MENLPSRLIGVFLAFIIMVLGPVTIIGEINDLTERRTTMNEMVNFINKVDDTGSVTDKEIADFYLGCAANGAVMDTKIVRLVKVVNPDGKGGTYFTYVPSDNIKQWNKGDIVQVRCKTLDYTGIQKFLWALTKFTTPQFDCTLAGMVRQ